jgi:hypothetical protein
MQIHLTTVMHRLKKPLIWSAAVFAVLTIFAFFGLPPLIKSLLIKRLSATLHREVSIQKISVNPFALSLTVRGFLIKDRASSEAFASFDELFINLQGLSALRRALIVKEIRVSQPFIRVVRHEDNSYNFSDLLTADESQKSDAKHPLQFSLNNIQILDGSVDFLDEPKRKKHTVRGANISIPFLSNLPYLVETFVQPAFSATINDTQYALGGKTKPFAASRETTLDIKIDNLDIAYYFPYVPVETAFTILSGYMDAKVEVSFVQQTNGQRALGLKGDLGIKQVSIHDAQDSPLLTLPLLNMSIASAEPFVKRFHMALVSLESPELHIQRDGTGAFNIASLFPRKQETQQGPGIESDAAPLSIDVDEIRMVSGKLSFSDQSRISASGTALKPDDEEKINSEGQKPGEQVTLKAEDVNLRVANLSTREGQRGDVSLSFSFNPKGRVATKGSIGLYPLFAQLAVDVKNVDIRPVQPYFTDRVKIIVTNGNVSSSGNLLITDQKGVGPQMTYKGDASLSRFSSIDKARAEDFVTWESLSLGGLTVGYNPTSLRIQRVALSDFFARVIIYPDGSINLQQTIYAKPEQAAPVTATAPRIPDAPSRASDKDVQDTRVQKVTLQGGRIDFSDRSVKPNFSLKLVEMGGSISGLSSEETTLADVELRGKVDQAPLEIMGKINPLRRDLFIDLKAKFRDIDLSPMTPYSGKYIGYTIQKGKLGFDVSYQIVKKKVDAQNNVFFDQLTLGDRVESPTATNLPVRLAIALLKDRKGEIRLDIPVTGSLDDPQFSVWKIIVQILGNLIAKAATSPFALLGAAFGGGEELSYLDFDYGSATITKPNAQKLDTLIKALSERPSLKLEIEGHVDAEKDKEGLRQYIFNRKLQAQKLKEQVNQRGPAPSVDEIKVEPQEYEKYLKMAYKAEKFPKPRNFLGFEKSLPVPEMEKLMFTNIVVTDDDMKVLASQRSMNVKEMILQSGKIEPERIFIIQPKTLSPERREMVKDSRVDLRLA